MKVIVVADIFGFSSSLRELAQSLGCAYEIVDPYDGQTLRFNSEAEAYARFCADCGLERYTDMAREKVRIIEDETALVGMSVGASAIWNMSAEAGHVHKAVCFYGSRIRENPAIRPACETVLVFPEAEKHFPVPELSRRLANTPKVRCIDTAYRHGFMNRLSVNFDAGGYAEYLDWLRQNLI